MTLIDQLVRDEGEVLHPYHDSVGVLTIGVGHNLEAKPLPWLVPGAAIPQWLSRAILAQDIADARADLVGALPWAPKLGEERCGVLINMSFNLGIAGLLQFKHTLALIEDREWAAAAAAMLDSKWAKQVEERATRLAKQMQTGEWQ